MIKRFEAEAMNREQIEALSITSLEHNGFTTFIFEDDNGTFKELNAMTFYGSRKIDYVTYPDYVNRIEGLEAYKAYVKKQQEIKLLSFEDLSSVLNYDDYRKRLILFITSCRSFMTVKAFLILVLIRAISLNFLQDITDLCKTARQSENTVTH